jgi:hypothetical protein
MKHPLNSPHLLMITSGNMLELTDTRPFSRLFVHECTNDLAYTRRTFVGEVEWWTQQTVIVTHQIAHLFVNSTHIIREMY